MIGGIEFKPQLACTDIFDIVVVSLDNQKDLNLFISFTVNDSWKIGRNNAVFLFCFAIFPQIKSHRDCLFDL